MALVDFNHIKDVLDALDSQRPAKFGYTEAAVNATGAAEITALEGLFIVEDSTQINSIPTPDLVGMDPVILRIGLRTQASTISRMAINHFFGRLGLNLLKVTEKLKLLVDEHLVNRYITPSGNVLERITVTQDADEIILIQHQSPLSASSPVTASAPVTLLPAVYDGNAGVMTGADKKVLDDTASEINNTVKLTGEQSIAGVKTFTSIPILPDVDPTEDNQVARRRFVVSQYATQTALIEASQQQNLVYNHDFRFFSNRLSTFESWYSYNHPDGWVFTDSGTDGKVGYDTSSECCKFQTSSDGSGTRSFKQALHEFVNWKKLLQGKTVTLKAFVKGANASARITDGVTSHSAALQNTGGIEEITLQIAVDAAATELTVLIETATASNSIEVYKVFANVGNYAIETLPCIIKGRIGDITMFGSQRTGAGDVLCNESALSRTIYSRLFSVVQTKYGAGDGISTFNVPGYNGLVPKGAGNATINGRTKTGPAFAAKQEDQGQGFNFRLYAQNANGIVGTNKYPSTTAGADTYTSTLTDAIAIVAGSNGPLRYNGDNFRDSSLGSCFYINWGKV